MKILFCYIYTIIQKLPIVINLNGKKYSVLLLCFGVSPFFHFLFLLEFSVLTPWKQLNDVSFTQNVDISHHLSRFLSILVLMLLLMLFVVVSVLAFPYSLWAFFFLFLLFLHQIKFSDGNRNFVADSLFFVVRFSAKVEERARFSRDPYTGSDGLFGKCVREHFSPIFAFTSVFLSSFRCCFLRHTWSRKHLSFTEKFAFKEWRKSKINKMMKKLCCVSSMESCKVIAKMMLMMMAPRHNDNVRVIA